MAHIGPFAALVEYTTVRLRSFRSILLWSMAGSTSNILDLGFTSEEGMVSNIEYLPGLSASDHLVLQFLVICYTSPSPSQLECKPALHKADFDLLRRGKQGRLGVHPGHGLPECLFLHWEEHIWSSRSLCTEDKTRKSSEPILTKVALKLRKKKKRRLWAAYVRSKNPDDYSKFATSRNSLRKMTRKLRAEFEAQIASQMKTNPKAFF